MRERLSGRQAGGGCEHTVFAPFFLFVAGDQNDGSGEEKGRGRRLQNTDKHRQTYTKWLLHLSPVS